MTIPPKLISVSQTCGIIGLGRTKVYELLLSNRLDSMTIGRRRLITVESVERLIYLASLETISDRGTNSQPGQHALYSHTDHRHTAIEQALIVAPCQDAGICKPIFSNTEQDGEN